MTMTNSTSTLPVSEQTSPSFFADSAIDVQTSRPSELSTSTANDFPHAPVGTEKEGDVIEEEGAIHHAEDDPISLSPVTDSLPDRMRQLAAAAWTLEQDDEMTESRRRKVDGILTKLAQSIEDEEFIYEEEEQTTTNSSAEATTPTKSSPLSDKSYEHAYSDEVEDGHLTPDTKAEHQTTTNKVSEEDLQQVHDSLNATVESMRLRNQEQKHLHYLTVQKLEAIAQRCLAQEAQIQDLVGTVTSLRAENRTLGQENDNLHEKIAVLEEDRDRKEVAVSAMTSAVKGLEGWIESTSSPVRTPPSRSQHRFMTPTKQKQLQRGFSPQQRQQNQSDLDHAQQNIPQVHNNPSTASQQRRSIIRGRGRFRGRYFVDDDNHEGTHIHDEYPFTTTENETQDLQDGVKAWIRGFRDVEECVAGTITATNAATPLPYRELQHKREEDEWGDFQSPGVQDVV